MSRLRDREGRLLGEEFTIGDQTVISYNLGDDVVFPPSDWGPWTLDTRHLVLKCMWYEIDLKWCLTSAQVMDWIFQIRHKSWADSEIIAGLIQALDDILEPQTNLCSGGQSREVTRQEVRKLARQAAASRRESLRIYADDGNQQNP
jgi:hypothetical protein